MFYVGSAEVVLLDAAARSVSADWRKKPSSVVHSRTVTVSVLAVTSVMLTLSINDLTPGGGSHTSVWRPEWTGDQCAGLQRFISGDPTADDTTFFTPALPDGFLPASGVFLRPLTSLFLILSRRTDGDDDDVWRGDLVVVELECWRAPYVDESSSTDREAAAAAEPPTFRRELSS